MKVMFAQGINYRIMDVVKLQKNQFNTVALHAMMMDVVLSTNDVLVAV